MFCAQEESIAVLASSPDDSSKMFFVGTMPEISKANYFARSVLHSKEDFIMMLPSEEAAKKVVRYMNDRPQTFHGWDDPIDLAEKVKVAIRNGELTLV